MAGTWECSRCGEENILSRSCCFMCYTDKPLTSPTKNKVLKRKKISKVKPASEALTPLNKLPPGPGPKTPPGPYPGDKAADNEKTNMPLFPGPRTPPGPCPESSPEPDSIASMLQRNSIPETPPSSESPIRGNVVASRSNTIRCPFCKRMIDNENCPTCQTLVCWRCRFCKTLFTLDNERCKVCKADRDDATSRDTSQDWFCRYCKVANYHKRSLCFSCKAYKEMDDSRSLSTLGVNRLDYQLNSDSFGYGYDFDSIDVKNSPSNSAGPSSTDIPLKKEQNERAEKHAQRAASKSRAKSTRQANGKPEDSKITPKPGDWYCRYCKCLNFKVRETCFTCRAFKEVSETSERESSPAPIASFFKEANSSKSLSTWVCKECNFRNLMFRMHCYQCGNGRHPFQRNISNDWTCETCYTVNSTDMFDRGCYICYPLKNQADPELASAISRLDSKVNIKTIPDFGNKSSMTKEKAKDDSEKSLHSNVIVAPYDWVCPLCKFANIALRNFCKGCDAPRSSIVLLLIEYRKKGIACFTNERLMRQVMTPASGDRVDENTLTSNNSPKIKRDKKAFTRNDEIMDSSNKGKEPFFGNTGGPSSLDADQIVKMPEEKVYEEGEIKDEDDSSNGSKANIKAADENDYHDSNYRDNSNPPGGSMDVSKNKYHKNIGSSKGEYQYERDHKHGLLVSPRYTENNDYRPPPRYRPTQTHRPSQRAGFNPHSYMPLPRRPHQQPLLRAPHPKYPRPRFRNY